MREKSVLPVKYEQSQTEDCLSSFGGILVFIEFLKGLGFDRMVFSCLEASSNQGFHPLHHLLTLVLINLTGGQSVSDVDQLENDGGLTRFRLKMEKGFAGLKGRVFRKGRQRDFPSPSRIFEFLDRFNSPEEDRVRQNMSKGTSRLLPTGADLDKLVAINREVVTAAQKLRPQKVATLDMDNNLIISQKQTAKVSYRKYPAYQPFNVYWADFVSDFSCLIRQFLLTKPVNSGQTSITGMPYFLKTRSCVTIINPSSIACAIIILSNGSRWCTGRSPTLNAWLAVIESNSNPCCLRILGKCGAISNLPSACFMRISQITATLTKTRLSVFAMASRACVDNEWWSSSHHSNTCVSKKRFILFPFQMPLQYHREVHQNLQQF